MGAAQQASAWAKNLSGLAEVSEAEMETIPYAMAELGLHITTKTAQAGSFLGGFVIGPIVGLISVSSLFANFLLQKRPCAMRYGTRGMAIGAVLGPAVTFAHSSKLAYGQEGAFDRAFRIRHNGGQCNVDRWTYALGAVGLVAGGGAGLALGVRSAVVGAAAYNNVLKPRLGPKEAEE